MVTGMRREGKSNVVVIRIMYHVRDRKRSSGCIQSSWMLWLREKPLLSKKYFNLSSSESEEESEESDVSVSGSFQ